MSNILTLRLDAASQSHFEALRQRYFPPERNQIAAHLTLFHTLPESPEINARLTEVAGEHAPFRMQVTGVGSLGRGVAYRLESPQLMTVHARLAQVFATELSTQDRQRFQPHIVVQNKVIPAEARALLAELQSSFVRTHVEALGLDLWHYLDGPWEHAATFAFAPR